MNPRFFVEGRYATGDSIALGDEEAQHLTRVLRLRSGAAVRVFDGLGHEFNAVVTTATKGQVTLTVGEPRASARESGVAVTIAHAILKADKMDDVIRDAVMIGVAAIQPILTARSEVSPAALARGNRTERWRRVAVSSAKQCGRAVVPPIAPPIDLDTLIDGLRRGTRPQPALMLVEPSAAADSVALSETTAVPPLEATIVIGPEGGWTPAEIAAAATVCRMVRLGGRTLRADAVAMVALAALFTRWGEF